MRALAACAVTLAACWHAGSGDPRVATSDPRDDVLAYIPAKAEIVIGVDGARARSSRLWRRIDALATEQMGAARARFRDRCGYDPLSIERATVAVWDLGGKTSMLAVVRGIDPQRLEACLRGELRAAATRDAGMWHLEIPFWGAGELAVLGSTSVLYVARDATASTLDGLLHGGAPLRRDDAFARLVREIPDNASAWAIGREASALKGPNTFTVGVVFDDGIDARATATFDDPHAAADLQAWASRLPPGFGKLDVSVDGTRVTMRARASGEQIDALLRRKLF